MRWDSRAPRSSCACGSTPRGPWRSRKGSREPRPPFGGPGAWGGPLQNSFSLTATVGPALAVLAAIYGAIFSAQRLVRPVQDLIEGTRAVGKGDFGTRLPLPSRDEMGFLVHSFNDMTKRLRRARAEATESQQAVERERERLAIILARLSTGVVAIDRNMTVRTA